MNKHQKLIISILNILPLIVIFLIHFLLFYKYTISAETGINVGYVEMKGIYILVDLFSTLLGMFVVAIFIPYLILGIIIHIKYMKELGILRLFILVLSYSLGFYTWYYDPFYAFASLD